MSEQCSITANILRRFHVATLETDSSLSEFVGIKEVKQTGTQKMLVMDDWYAAPNSADIVIKHCKYGTTQTRLSS
jgi:hypothetical protein